MATPTFLEYACYHASKILLLLLFLWYCVFYNFLFLILQPIRLSDLRKVDPQRACEYFNNCFRDPSNFTVVVVGNINPSIALPLIQQYLVRVALYSVCLCTATFVVSDK